MKKLTLLILTLFCSVCIYAQTTDHLPSPAPPSVQSTFRANKLTDTALRELYVTYGSGKSDRLVRWPEAYRIVGNYIPLTNINIPNGVPGLDGSGKILLSQLPASGVDSATIANTYIYKSGPPQHMQQVLTLDSGVNVATNKLIQFISNVSADSNYYIKSNTNYNAIQIGKLDADGGESESFEFDFTNQRVYNRNGSGRVDSLVRFSDIAGKFITYTGLTDDIVSTHNITANEIDATTFHGFSVQGDNSIATNGLIEISTGDPSLSHNGFLKMDVDTANLAVFISFMLNNFAHYVTLGFYPGDSGGYLSTATHLEVGNTGITPYQTDNGYQQLTYYSDVVAYVAANAQPLPVSPPSSSSDTGISGQTSFDSTYFYWYDGTEWCRIAKDVTF